MLELDVLDAKLVAAKVRREKREAAAAADNQLRTDVQDLKRGLELLGGAVADQAEKIRALRGEVQSLRKHVAKLSAPRAVYAQPRRRQDGLDAELERGLYSD